MAGSRVVSQECDAVITLYDGPNGNKVIKPLAWRYYGDNDTEIHLRINEYCVLEYISTKNNVGFNTPKNTENNFDKIVRFIRFKGRVTIKELFEEFINTKQISKSSLFDSLKLQPIFKVSPGVYSIDEQDEENDFYRAIESSIFSQKNKINNV